MRRLRELAARLIRAHPDEIALVGPTSLALSFVAGGCRGGGDNIVVYQMITPPTFIPGCAAQSTVRGAFSEVPELGRIAWTMSKPR